MAGPGAARQGTHNQGGAAMRELSLFTGGGGGVLGSKLLGHRVVGYVEIEDYCQKIIRQRIDEGFLDDAPIFGDIRAFNREGYAAAYQGMVDIISGGFPCQDISCAGTGQGIHGERSGLWFEMEETIRQVGPRYVFIENSPMLLVRGVEHVIGGLAKMGFDCAWGIISAADAGAPHIRKRIWILAHSMPGGCGKRRAWRSVDAGTRSEKPKRSLFIATGKIPNSKSVVQGHGHIGDVTVLGNKSKARKPGRKIRPGDWWAVEPALGRVAYGVADGVDRLAAIGNGQVPAVAATAFRILQAILRDAA